MQQVDLELKSAIIREFGSQTAAARALALQESRLSRIVHGWATPSPDEHRRLKRSLGEEAVRNLKGR